MVKRYRYLTSIDGYRRINLFRREDPASPHWLMIQEFTDLTTVSDPSLKKREAEYWWRKNGCEGVVGEFFRLRQTQ